MRYQEILYVENDVKKTIYFAVDDNEHDPLGVALNQLVTKSGFMGVKGNASKRFIGAGGLVSQAVLDDEIKVLFADDIQMEKVKIMNEPTKAKA